MAEQTPESKKEVLATFKTMLHKVEAGTEALILSKKLPPITLEIEYKDIVSVEHRRLVDYGRLTGVAVAIGLAIAFALIDFVKDIIAAFILEVGLATGSTNSTTIDASIRASADQVSLYLAAIFILVAGYYALKFIFSLSQRLIIYRAGKKPLSIPFPLTDDAIAMLAKINEKVKEAGGISKKEAEEILGDKVRELLDNRVTMQKKMIADLTSQARTAKTPGEKALVKLMLKEGMDKLEHQDEAIDHELRKTGLSKADIFKKYRIKPPDKEFIDSILGQAAAPPEEETKEES